MRFLQSGNTGRDKIKLADKIQAKYGYTGGVNRIIIDFAEHLFANGARLKQSVQHTQRLAHTADAKKRLSVLAEKNLKEHCNSAVQEVERQLILLGIPYVKEKPVTYRFSTRITSVKQYILDFYLPKPINCIIEVDGSSHIGKEDYDKLRDERMKDKGLGTTIRIPNYKALAPGFDLYALFTKFRFIGPRIKKLIKDTKKSSSPTVRV